mmetsp:Transcript_35967/g.78800  ORF Transcript_35967/g.78800 Transcript_35967/m.78800 type:complete len:149 (+) Transcript_35967:101-547(+)|eukprot:CAMPEP_0178523026 /NCGR_PEP_ID=MMETSP0696-20121128/28858_1 /TAXON_ID=265572 /ORGANISM="Extubocellulus spinifer, Strain CCMP396" /LENGTH=148 /DNA_ID=CAMNT_0020154203 /DNA_START=76 /DNA_END=522 /DNA_ORIENTATION=-
MPNSTVVFRPIIVASLRADANRRVRTVGRRSLNMAPAGTASSAASTGAGSDGFIGCEPADKLRCILEQYRRQNFSRETPTRFKKELVRSVCSFPEATEVDVEGINHLLTRIGHGNDVLTKADQDDLLVHTVGHAATRTLPVDTLMKLI